MRSLFVKSVIHVFIFTSNIVLFGIIMNVVELYAEENTRSVTFHAPRFSFRPAVKPVQSKPVNPTHTTSKVSTDKQENSDSETSSSSDNSDINSSDTLQVIHEVLLLLQNLIQNNLLPMDKIVAEKIEKLESLLGNKITFPMSNKGERTKTMFEFLSAILERVNQLGKPATKDDIREIVNAKFDSLLENSTLKPHKERKHFNPNSHGKGEDNQQLKTVIEFLKEILAKVCSLDGQPIKSLKDKNALEAKIDRLIGKRCSFPHDKHHNESDSSDSSESSSDSSDSSDSSSDDRSNRTVFEFLREILHRISRSDDGLENKIRKIINTKLDKAITTISHKLSEIPSDSATVDQVRSIVLLQSSALKNTVFSRLADIEQEVGDSGASCESKIDILSQELQECCQQLTSKLDGIDENLDSCCISLNSKIDEIEIELTECCFTLNSKLDVINTTNCCATLNSKLDVIITDIIQTNTTLGTLCDQVPNIVNEVIDVNTTCTFTVIQWLKLIYAKIQ